MIGRKIVKIAALAIMGVVSFYMARWFGYKAVVGIILCEAAFGLYAGLSQQEHGEELIEETVDAIMDTLEEVCKDHAGEETVEIDRSEMLADVSAKLEEK